MMDGSPNATGEHDDDLGVGIRGGGARSPTISIVMPSHDNVLYLKTAIDSALGQSLAPLEIVVVDDGSTDGSQQVLRSYGERIRLLSVPPCTIGAARNAALAEVRGEYVLLLDADDVLLPWAVEVLTATITEHDRPTIVMSRWRAFREMTELPVLQGRAVTRRWPDFLAATNEPMQITTATAVRTDAVRGVGGFYEAHFGSEDMDLWLRLGAAPGFVYLDEAPIYGYRLHPTSTTHTASRLVPGIRFLMNRERRGVYPGGAARAQQRRHLIGRNVVFATARCRKIGAYGAAYALLASGVPWMVRYGLADDLWRLASKPLRLALRRAVNAARGSLRHLGGAPAPIAHASARGHGRTGRRPR